MPSSPGSARGLRVRACMTAPATARLAPHMIPRRVRGSRCWVTMVSAWPWPCPVSAAQTSRAGRAWEPKAIDAAIAATRRTAAAISHRTRRRRRRVAEMEPI